MEIVKGSIVRSKAGRDKGVLFLVVKREGEYAYVADGELRKVENPKKKKLKHLQGSYAKSDKDYSENYMVRNILMEYRKTV